MAVINFSSTSNDNFEFGGVGATFAIYMAQDFVADQNIGSLDVSLSTWRSGTPSDNLVLSIQTDSSNKPSGTPLASVSVAGSSLPTSAGAANFLGTITGLNLTNGTKYWLVGNRSGVPDSTNDYHWEMQVGGGAVGHQLASLNLSELPSSWEIHSDWWTRGSLTTRAPTATSPALPLMGVGT